MGVTYSRSALQSIVGRGGRLQLRMKQSDRAAVESFRAAVLEAWPEPPPDAEAFNGYYSMDVSSIGPGEGGPMAVISHCDNDELLDAFLHALVARLEAAGLDGRLVRARGAEIPMPLVPSLTLALKMKLDWDAITSADWYGSWMPPLLWWVDRGRTQRCLTPLVDWCLAAPGDVHVQIEAAGFRPAREDVTDLILDSVQKHRGTFAMLAVIDEKGEQLRSLKVNVGGEFQLHSWHPSVHWLEQLDGLVALLPQLAGDIVNGIVRIAPSNKDHRGQIVNTVPKASVQIGDVTTPYDHLEPEYLWDAYGVLVITDEHLARIGDLPSSRWLVTPLGSGRHLLRAVEQAAWFDVDPKPYVNYDYITNRPQTPVQAVLDQARDDLRPALLRDEFMRSNPITALHDRRE